MVMNYVHNTVIHIIKDRNVWTLNIYYYCWTVDTPDPVRPHKLQNVSWSLWSFHYIALEAYSYFCCHWTATLHVHFLDSKILGDPAHHSTVSGDRPSGEGLVTSCLCKEAKTSTVSTLGYILTAYILGRQFQVEVFGFH